MQKKVSFYIFLSLVLGISNMLCAATTELDNRLAAQAKLNTQEKQIEIEVSEGSGIIAGATFAAIIYGIGRSQIAAAVCPEYFTEGFYETQLSISKSRNEFASFAATNGLVVRSLCLGVAETWGFGVGLGISAAAAARLGSWPKLDAKDLMKPVVIGGATIAGTSLVAGGAGYVASKMGLLSVKSVEYVHELAGDTPSGKMHAYTANLFADDAGWYAGAAVACGLVGWIVYERYSREQAEKKKLVAC